MSDTVIIVEKLSKQYTLGGQRHDTLRDRLGSLLHSRAVEEAGRESFWALRDVSFEISRGDIVGVIGKNGAGKSTLLKILSRITEPTSGRIELRGRVGSLLEVGSGFHPELSGRDNVFLNGAILGMKRAEIQKRFDEIVAFAEIEKFIDTPVKRYSSGMYMRLAFAVAAHMSSEILFVDEVLAVGDAAFHEKCIGKMTTLANNGRTIIFVSHNLSSLRQLCTHGVCLQQGTVSYIGHTAEAITHYLRLLETSVATPLARRTDRTGVGNLRLVSLDIRNMSTGSTELATGDIAQFVFALSTYCTEHFELGFTIYDDSGTPVCHLNTRAFPPSDLARTNCSEFTCTIRDLPLLPGKYRLAVNIISAGVNEDWLSSAATFRVHSGLYRGRNVGSSDIGYGRVYVDHEWRGQ